MLVYVSLYSFLPHKELRFVFPALPMLYMAAAVGLDQIMPLAWDTQTKTGGIANDDNKEHCGGLAASLPSSSSSSSSSSPPSSSSTSPMPWSRYLPRMLFWACVGGLLLVSASLSASFAYASTLNYPGKGGHIYKPI